MAISPDNIKAQMRKGFVEYAVLLLIDNEPTYASEIIKSLKEVHFIVVEGTLYPMLTRLKKEGLLTYKWEESTQGPPRKYYQITQEGKTFLSELETNWIEINHVINHLKKQS